MLAAGLLASMCTLLFPCLLLLYLSCIIGVRWLDPLGSGFLCHLVLSVGVDRQSRCALGISVCSCDLSEMFNVWERTRHL